MSEFLSVKQLAEHLQVSERTIYRMLWRGDLPGRRVGSQWRFSKSQVDFWLDLRLARLAPPDLREMSQGADPGLGPLGAALSPGNALIPLSPDSPREVIRALVAAVEFSEPVDRKVLTARIWAREDMSSTSTAEGVAFLHTARWESRALVGTNLVAIGRLPVVGRFGAPEDPPADLLFLLLARDPRNHLALLAGAAHLSRVPDFLAGIRSARTGAEVVELVRRLEASLPLEQET